MELPQLRNQHPCHLRSSFLPKRARDALPLSEHHPFKLDLITRRHSLISSSKNTVYLIVSTSSNGLIRLVYLNIIASSASRPFDFASNSRSHQSRSQRRSTYFQTAVYLKKITNARILLWAADLSLLSFFKSWQGAIQTQTLGLIS